MSAESIIRVALGEVGYQEKSSNSQLESKTANAGSNNYTKYGAWYGMNGQPWCDMFVSWCAEQAGEENAVGKFAYVPSHKNFFTSKGQYFARGVKTPIPGDIVIFRNESHIGIVEYVSGNIVHTIEGNTSGDAGLEPDGGQVAQKSYYLTSTYIIGYCRPAYSESEYAAEKPEYFNPVRLYKNGSTEENCYADSSLTVKTGSLNQWETCDCIGKIGGKRIVCYPVDGTDEYKVGIVSYDGGVN